MQHSKNTTEDVNSRRLSVLYDHLHPDKKMATLSHSHANSSQATTATSTEANASSASNQASEQHNTFQQHHQHTHKKLYAITPSIVPKNFKSNLPNELQRSLKTLGWGFQDTEFLMKTNGDVTVSGSRYPVLSSKSLPNFREFFEKEAGLDSDQLSMAQTMEHILSNIPKENIHEPFLQELKQAHCYKFLVHDAESRLMHSHGHSLQEIFRLRYGKFNRVVDLVVYPESHEQVEQIVKLCAKYKDHVCLIPYGGGTTVTQSLLCPENEKRCIVSLDTHEMNRILWVDKQNNTACIQAGCTGVQIHDQLKERGVVLGHEPDSWEFSTMGGWVATRASGMKKNRYGNIEDFLLSAKVVTVNGTIDCDAQSRKSHGPDVLQMILGSEGCFGVVTECIVTIQKYPRAKRYGAIVFPTFENGVKCLREVYDKGLRPAALRLVDNMNFRMGSSLKERRFGFDKRMHAFEDTIKKIYVTKMKGMHEDQICAATMCLEGDHHEVSYQEKRIFQIAAKYGGINGGSEAGKQGFLLTHVIAYLRDYAMAYYFLAESFETCVPWAKVVGCVEAVKQRIREEGKRRGIIDPQPWVCARISQSYGSGACCYFYFGFVFKGVKNPVKVFSQIEDAARDEILHHGGALSHHHGVGKLRRRWMKQVWSDAGFDLIKRFKEQVDPDNLFAAGNMHLTPAIITDQEDFTVREYVGNHYDMDNEDDLSSLESSDDESDEEEEEEVEEDEDNSSSEEDN